ncbi:Nuclear protein localization protein 4-like protein isoform X1 [Oopsacas minuta]|uniref:Nuclear protein localization protein 4-like protein isoform X1 n=1 Tax=Oopsacas minuta TaxID=111878 RepID=A0AAV7K6X1_9METZ|nr:Nuclear protein localization protein 4-like protein isoform X1 [Oopsacas minuta]
MSSSASRLKSHCKTGGELIIVRVRNDTGTKRIQIKPSASWADLLLQIRAVFSLPNETFTISIDPKGESNVAGELHKLLSQLGVVNGTLLYLKVTGGSVDMRENENEMDSASPMELSPTLNGETMISKQQNSQAVISPQTYKPAYIRSLSLKASLFEDNVDKKLASESGLIARQRDPSVCQHGARGQCINCAPLEPYNQTYLESHDPPIRHLSFHSYLRKLAGGADKGKFVSLEDLSFKLKPGCTEHPSWPNGICSKCSPGVVTLKRQEYRHVDLVQFQDPSIVDRFISYWRTTGSQRIGYLYGQYEEYNGVPLGIKATVLAIYEPPQISTRDSVELLEDSRESVVESLADWLGIRRVGWIFTDLEASLESGKVHYKRHMHTFFLSAEECIMAANFQNKHPNLCKLASMGKFGSKFVTVCVEGNQDNEIEMRGYQVSNQCMALVRDDCLVPCLDASELGYIRESTSKQYVPDVYYKTTIQKREITLIGKPLPMDFMLLDIPVSAPMSDQLQQGMKLLGRADPFPIENRESARQLQNNNTLIAHLSAQPPNQFIGTIADFHLLFFLTTTDLTDLTPHLPELCDGIRRENVVQVYNWKESNPAWRTIEECVRITSETLSPRSMQQGPPTYPSGSVLWSCKECTFFNSSGDQTCSMCGTRK